MARKRTLLAKNELLKGERVITDLTFLDKEILPDEKDARSIIYDVYCTTDTGEHIIVEMQNKTQPHFMERSVYYVSSAIVTQGRKGQEFDYQINAVYGVFMLNFRERALEEKFRTDVILADRENHRMVNDKMRFIYLQLPLFHNKEAECVTDFEKWIYLLKHMDVLDRMPWTAQSQVFKKLAEIGDLAKLSQEEFHQYTMALKVYRDNKAMYDGAIQEGFRKGEAEGEAKGIVKVAKNMKSIGIPIDQIQQATGLSPEEIKKL